MDDETPAKGEIEREHSKRVKEKMSSEEEALKASRVVKGADNKKYKKFSDRYVPLPELELPDEVKLKVARNYQILNGFMGFAGIVLIFFIIFNSTLNLSIFENFIIVFNIYHSTLYLSLFEGDLALEINLILLGCAMIATSIIGIIHFQRKHDKISDRISSGRSVRNRIKRAMRKYHGLIIFMGVLGIGMIFLGIHYLSQYASIFENFIIVLNIEDAMLYLSILESFVIKANLILLGFVLAVASTITFSIRRRRR